MKKITVPEYNVVDKAKKHTCALATGARELVMPATVTTHYPRERRKVADNFRGYILFEVEKCINCFQCAFVCPANAVCMKEAPNKKYYPTIDYAKCIFCHFCIDSCAGGALKPTKILDVAYKDIDEMLTLTEEMIEQPEIIREDVRSVEYVLTKEDLVLKRNPGEDSLFVKVTPPPEIPMVSQCVEPESCLGCGICEEMCESAAISSLKEDGMVRMKIDTDKCTGCGLCVKECSMQILRLVRK